MSVSIRRFLRKTSSDVAAVSQLPPPVHDVYNGRKNVLIMIPSIGGGGAERVACIVASYLAEFCNVTLVYEKEKENSYQIDPRVQVLRSHKFIFNSFMQLYFLHNLKKKYRINVSISLMHKMNSRNVFSRHRDFVIVSERNNPKQNRPEEFSGTCVTNALADHVVFQTREVQAMYNRHIQAYSSILPNPVFVTCKASACRKARIVNVARLHPNKNQKMLICAFSRFSVQHPEYVLELYGNGELEESLNQLAQDLGIFEKVIFHGNVENVHEQIADAGMFVLSSNVEGMPNALLEAMMMGLPCISTNCTGAKEVIQNGENGILVDVGDTDALAEAMEYMAEHPGFAEKCRKKAMETVKPFQKDEAMKQWLELVQKS